MEILSASGPPETKRAFIIRSKPFHNFLAFLLTVALTVGFVWGMGVKAAGSLGWGGYLLAPFVLLGGLLMLLIVAVAWGVFKASLRPTNWSWVIRESEVFINLRDYRNAQAGEPTPVLHLRAEDLVQAVVVKETYKTKTREGTTFHSEKHIQLRVEDLDTEALRVALAKAAKHPGVVTKKGKSITKFQTQPLQWIGGDVLRVPYSRRLQFCLEHVVKFDEPQKINLDESWGDLKPLERALELRKRGHHFRAEQWLAKEEQLSLKEARELLKEFEGAEREAA